MLMPASLPDRKVAASYLRMSLTSYHGIGTLNQKRLDIDTSTGDGDRKFFACTFVIYWSKTCPGA